MHGALHSGGADVAQYSAGHGLHAPGLISKGLECGALNLSAVTPASST